MDRIEWQYLEQYGCWSAEEIVYCSAPINPKLQCMNIYIPKEYLDRRGTVCRSAHMGGYTAETAPLVCENSIGGYMQARPEPLSIKPTGQELLRHGIIYITCGARGRGTKTSDGKFAGKAPAALVDLKAAVRFLRQLREQLPGNMERIISFGGSAGGALSALLGVTGNSDYYAEYLEEIGAFRQRDDVFAAQCYCPITNLGHADSAYEWMYSQELIRRDPFEGNMTMTPFQAALSRQHAAAYIDYFNSLELPGQTLGSCLSFNADGRSGTAYQYLMDLLEDSAAVKLRELEQGNGDCPCTAEEYLSGAYTRTIHLPDGEKIEQGEDLRDCLTWDGSKASLTGLDDMIRCACPRMKMCQAFDGLELEQPENQVFGTNEQLAVHFDFATRDLIQSLKREFPNEYERFAPAFEACASSKEVARQLYLFEPLNFLCSSEHADVAPYYRIRLGTRDGHTSFTVSMALAQKLKKAGIHVDYAFVWGEGHGQPDSPGALRGWVDSICGDI